jgi:hypothetical protein
MYEDRGDIAKVSRSEQAVWNKGFVEILSHDRGSDVEDLRLQVIQTI